VPPDQSTNVDGFLFEVLEDTFDLEEAAADVCAQREHGHLAVVDTQEKADAIKAMLDDKGISSNVLIGN